MANIFQSLGRTSRWLIAGSALLILGGLLFLAYRALFPAAPPPPQLDVAMSGEPALFRVSGKEGGQAYLFGTVHVLPEGVEWRSETFETAFASADRLIIEVTGLEDTDKSAKTLARLGVSKDLPPIRKRLQPDLVDEYEAVMDGTNVPEFALNKMESWAAALTLGATQAQALGLRPELGVEQKLIADFKKSGKPIAGLETIEQQLGYFDKLTEEQQRIMLNQVIADADETKESFEELFNAWISADLGHLGKLADESFLTEPELRERLLIARNRDWTNQIEAMLKKPGTAFIAVGAAHLAGRDSVQSMLEARGFKIERVE